MKRADLAKGNAGTTFPKAHRHTVPDAAVRTAGLSGRMRHTAHAIAEVLFATREGPPPEDRLEWTLDDVDDFIAHAGPRARLVFWLCLTATSLVAPLFVGRPYPLRWLTYPRRVQALTRMERSVFGLALFGVKAVLSVVYYEHPDAARAIGFDGRCRGDGGQAASP